MPIPLPNAPARSEPAWQRLSGLPEDANLKANNEPTVITTQLHPKSPCLSLQSHPGTRGSALAQRIVRRYRIFVAFCSVLILAGVWLRVVNFGRWPGINGDEAWYGVQAQRMLQGEGFSWRTPTGNPWNPLLMIPRVLLEMVGEPSFEKLRLPAVISGLLTLVVNFWLARRALGRRGAWLTTTALAVLPIAIIYSRIAWDSCQTILVSLPVIYLPLIANRTPKQAGRLRNWSSVWLCMAILVHPTNLFLLPLWFVLLWPRWEFRWPLLRSRETALASLIRVALPLCVVIALFGVPRGWADWQPSNGAFLSIARLVTGETVEVSFNQPGPIWSMTETELPFVILMLWRVSWWIVAILGAVAILRKYQARVGWRRGENRTMPGNALNYVAAGLAVSLAVWQIKVGPTGLTPGFERYGLWMIAPLVVYGVLLWERSFAIVLAFGRKQCAWRYRMNIGVGGLFGLTMCGFTWFALHRDWELTGGHGHETYRTATVEPKLQAWRIIHAESRGTLPPRIVVTSWWLEWPLKYLSNGRANVCRIESSDVQSPCLQPQPGQDLWIADLRINGGKCGEFASCKLAEELNQNMIEHDLSDLRSLDLIHLYHRPAR